MKRISIRFILAAAAVLQSVAMFAAEGPSRHVSPLVGTLSKFELSTGNTYPAIAMPWGMNFWTPQTGKMGDGWTYTYNADKIRGLKQTHQPSPWINDYGQFSIMPVTGSPVFDEDKRASWFSHKAEEARPYYYKVYLADHDVVAEVAPTERAAIMRFTFPECDSSFVVIDAFDHGSAVTVIPEQRKIVGYTTKNSGGVPDNFRNYFEIVFDTPIEYYATVKDGVISQGVAAVEADHSGAIVGFKTARGQQVHARVASSFISPDQASVNLRELGDRGFDAVMEAGRQTWDDTLSRITVEDDDIDNLRTFYSCLYRSVLFPRSFYEIDAAGNVVHYSPYNGKVLPGYMFTDTGFWDTFRCLFPLLNLVYPSMNEKMQAGLANAYRESGFLPEWASPGHRGCMVGNNSASVVADAWLKGVRVSDADMATLWEAVTSGAHKVHPEVSSTGRLGHELYNKLGYVPCDSVSQSAARTLEYAYDDWCIYKLGQSLGKSKKELKEYADRALNYKNLFDPEHRLMRGRNADGTFQSPFNPVIWGSAFTEGNSWHYSWSVFHDPKGLMNLMGGRDGFNQMLDSVFVVPASIKSFYDFVIHEIREMQIMNMGNYAHGNQPIQHMIYLYDYSGQPWKTQQRAREVMDKLYTPYPDGYCGDEDNGQTSAWYVFSAMGFYPVCPGSGQYAIGSPLFKKATLNLENGNTLVIDAPANSSETVYVDAITVNGKTYDLNYFDHAGLTAGGNVRFDMTSSPNTSRGTSEKSAPYSFSDSKK